MESPRIPEPSEGATSVGRARSVSTQQTTSSSASRVHFSESVSVAAHELAHKSSTSSQGSRKILFADNVRQPKQRALTARAGTSPPPVR